MKKIFLSTVFIISTLFANAQAGTQVDYSDNFGSITLTYNGVVNSKESYQGTDAGATVTVSWSGTQWEIDINVGAGDILSFANTTITAMNPPDFNTGTWTDEAVDGTDLLGLSGTGTTATVVPVELLSFNAMVKEQTVSLNWKTASEENNAGFEVQRSTDVENFETLYFVEGNGTTLEEQTYTYDDKTVRQNEKYYYRLKQVDFDGQFEYTDVISASVNGKTLELGNFYPNPTKGLTRLDFEASQNTDLIITVFNLTGQELLLETRNVNEGLNNLELDFSDLPTGNYFVRLQAGERAVYQKLIID